MNETLRKGWKLCAIVLCGLWCLNAAATDRLRVRFLSGYPPPGVSSEMDVLEVTRVGGFGERTPNEVDNLFESVRAVLSRYRVKADWASLPVDAPFVEVIVELDGRKTALAVGADQRARSRIPKDIAEMDDDTRHMAAMEELIRLARERTSARLAR